MRVIYFHQHFTTPQGSSGIRSYEIARRLVGRGHEVLMVCGRSAGCISGLEHPFRDGMRRGFVDGIEVLEFDLPYSNHDRFLRRTATFLRFAIRSSFVAIREKGQIVFATTTPLTAGIPGIVARWLGRKRFVFEVRDLWPELPRAMGVIQSPFVLGAMSMLEWASYRSAHRLVGLSPGIVQGIIRRGVGQAKVKLVPNGCDLQLFSSAQPWRPSEVGASDLMAVFAGTHGIANGLDAVLDAAAILKSMARHDIKLVLVGDGLKKPELRQRAEAQKLANVVFLDPLRKARLAGLLGAADVGLQVLRNVPAFYDGTSPNKFFDYLAAGLPVLINYPGWLAEVMEDSGSGFVVAPDSPQEFAEALIRAADDRGALAGMGRAAQKLAAHRFDRRELADSLVDWIEEASA